MSGARCPHCGTAREARADGRFPKHAVSRLDMTTLRTLREPCPGSEIDARPLIVEARAVAAEARARDAAVAADRRDAVSAAYAADQRASAEQRIVEYAARTAEYRALAARETAAADAIRRGAT